MKYLKLLSVVGCFFAGLGLIAVALVRSRNVVETFSHFKRFRLKSLKRVL